MRYFQCPKCSLKVHAIATDVSHRCPSNKNLNTAFVQIPGPKETK